MNIYLIGLNKTNPKDSHVYSKDIASGHMTPKGSHKFDYSLFYKHPIPSGF